MQEPADVVLKRRTVTQEGAMTRDRKAHVSGVCRKRGKRKGHQPVVLNPRDKPKPFPTGCAHKDHT